MVLRVALVILLTTGRLRPTIDFTRSIPKSLASGLVF
jgi:hypothetical protein